MRYRHSRGETTPTRSSCKLFKFFQSRN